jgi:hypothetical protein
MPAAAPERRRSRRYNLALAVKVLRLDRESVEMDGQTRNVSSVGAYFRVDWNDLLPGTPLEFHLSLEPTVGSVPVTLRCRGRVARVDSAEGDSGPMVAATIDRYQFQRPAAVPTGQPA